MSTKFRNKSFYTYFQKRQNLGCYSNIPSLRFKIMPNSFIASIWPCMQLKYLHIQPVLKKYTMDTPTCRIGYATLAGFSFTILPLWHIRK